MHKSGLPLQAIYERLYALYGPQGWWPLRELAIRNPHSHGYHPGEYDYPRNRAQRFEICVGAILTQNTSWKNAENALHSLHDLGGLETSRLMAMPRHALAEAIHSAGYYNAKAAKLRELALFFSQSHGGAPTRKALLSVWGIGPETADSILLYAYRQPEMVVDAYTRRILAGLHLVPERCSYDALKSYCKQQMTPNTAVYQEFHALMVRHAKQYYRRHPYRDDILADGRPLQR